jgi:hypothetical protein
MDDLADIHEIMAVEAENQQRANDAAKVKNGGNG